MALSAICRAFEGWSIAEGSAVLSLLCKPGRPASGSPGSNILGQRDQCGREISPRAYGMLEPSLCGGRARVQRRDFFCSGRACSGLGARSASPAAIASGNWLARHSGSPSNRATSSGDAFFRGLNEVGFEEGRTVAIEYRWRADTTFCPPLRLILCV